MIRVIFMIVIIVKTFAVDLSKGKPCVTPYGENVTCVPLFSCAVVTSALGTFTQRAVQFAKDSGCGCDMGMACCGSFYNESYSPLVNCSVSPQQEIPTMSSASDKTSLNALAKDTSRDLPKGKSCITPYGENASCVPLVKCDFILSALDTEEERGQRLYKDSKCGCDAGMVCCGIDNKESYTPLTNCAPPSQPEKIRLSYLSDPSVCGLDSSTDRIKGGSVVKLEEHPWIAALEYQSKVTKENAGFRCGGSIITKRFILTAAHCMVDVEFMIIKVWLGVTNTSSQQYCPNLNNKVQCINTVQEMNVENTIPHEFYNSIEKFNDIGMLKLEKDIQFSNYIRPICLPSSESELPKIGTYLTVAGWGTTENRKTSEIKLKVEVPLRDNNICNEHLKIVDKEITSKQLCVGGEKGKDSCQGDSGGPLMYDFVGINDEVQWIQHGIVSYGRGCGVQGRPGVYTKVSSYDRWIYNKVTNGTSNLGKDEPCTTLNGTIGTCVPLTICEEHYKALFTKKKVVLDVIMELLCGGDSDAGILVCCENPGSTITPNWNSTALPDKTTCGILKNEPRIDGTEIKNLAAFPWVAGIEYFSKDLNTSGIKCIGTVISSRYVLTSADCLATDNYFPINVWLGHWNTSAYNDCKEVNNTVDCTNPVQKIKIKTTTAHQLSNFYYNHYDIILYFLENEIRFSDYIRPICLPTPNLPKLEPGMRMTTLTWTEEITTEYMSSSDMMLKEEIPLVSNDKCKMLLKAWKGPDLSPPLQMCVEGEATKHHCKRLPGAPIMRSYENKPSGMIQWSLEGLVIYNYFDCSDSKLNDFPGLYIRVDGHLYWIINIISED